MSQKMCFLHFLWLYFSKKPKSKKMIVLLTEWLLIIFVPCQHDYSVIFIIFCHASMDPSGKNLGKTNTVQSNMVLGSLPDLTIIALMGPPLLCFSAFLAVLAGAGHLPPLKPQSGQTAQPFTVQDSFAQKLRI